MKNKKISCSVVFFILLFAGQVDFKTLGQPVNYPVDIGSLITFSPVRDEWRGFNQPYSTVKSWMADSAFQAEFVRLRPGILRWPGGTKGNSYDWMQDLNHPVHFNMQAMAAFTRQMNMKVNYMLNFGTTTSAQAAELVRFCNSGKPKYQAMRDSLLGDSARLNIQYWEIGNEIANPWTFGVSWLAWDSVLHFRNGQVKPIDRYLVDSLYYYGGGFRREGWVPENNELNKVSAILGEVYFPDSTDPDTIDIYVQFPKISPDSIRVFAFVSNLSKNDLAQYSQQQVYNMLASPAFELDSSQFHWKNDSAVTVILPVQADSVLAVLVEYNSVEHPGAFELRDSMKAADSTIQIGYEVKFLGTLDKSSLFTNRLKSSPPEFMIFHGYNRSIVYQFYNTGHFSEIVYQAERKAAHHISFQKKLDSLSQALGIQPIKTGLTEWNLTLCDSCPVGWHGVVIALYDAAFWSAFYTAGARDDIHLSLINHFAVIGSGQNHIQMFHINNGNLTMEPAVPATRMVNECVQSPAGLLLASDTSQIPTMPLISKNDSTGLPDTLMIPAFVILGSMEPDSSILHLLIINRDDDTSYPVRLYGRYTDTVIVETLTGVPQNAGISMNLDTLVFSPATNHVDYLLDSYSMAAFHLHLAPTPIGMNSEPGMAISVSPNPANNFIEFTCETLATIFVTTTVSNPQGEVLWQKTFRSGPGQPYRGQISTAGLPTGMYFLTLTSENQKATRKFVVTH